MLERAEILRKLEAEGLDLDSRKLTDWVAKRYVPKFSSTGRGPGKVYFSEDPDIMKRLRLVAALMEGNWGQETVLIALWLNGYDISAKALKNAYEGRLGVVNGSLDGIISHPQGSEEGISQFAASYAKKLPKYLNIDINEVMPGIEEFIRLTAGTFIPSEDANIFISDTTKEFCAKAGASRDLIANAGNVHFGNFAVMMQYVLTIPVVNKLIRETSIEALRVARDHALKLSDALFPKVADILPPPDKGLTLKECFRVAFGRSILPALVSGVKKDRRKIKETVLILETAFSKTDFVKLFKATNSNMTEHMALGEAIIRVGTLWGNPGLLTFSQTAPITASIC